MPSARRSEAPRSRPARPAAPAFGPQIGRAVAATPRMEPAGLGAVETPRLPPFWMEWGRVVARRWPLPVFVLGVLASAVVFLARPKGEPARSAEQYVEIARTAFGLAVAAQDERSDLRRALEFLAGRNVEELAEVLEQARGQVPTAQPPGDARDKALGIHGVLPSYQRAEALGGKDFLGSDDLAIMGEAFWRMARIKQASEDAEVRGQPAEAAGRKILASAPELYRSAEQRLVAARAAVGREAGGRFAGDEGQKAAEAAAAALGGPEWRRRRRLLAECQAELGQYPAALNELRTLAETLSASRAEELRSEKEPGARGASPSARRNARSADEWAEIYELTARCYYRSGQGDQAAEHYRLFLERSTGGQLAHRARLRLAELVMAKAVAGDQAGAKRDVAGIRAGLEEVCRLCAQVEQSDAPGALRENATFLLGRAAYRLGGLETEPGKPRSRYEEAVAAFRYPYAPGGPHQDMSRVLLARSLYLAGRGDEAKELEAKELLAGILRIGAQPAIYACAEVSRADMLVESDPEEAFGGRELASGMSHGYVEAIRHIRDLSAAELGRLSAVPELAALLADKHFVAVDPDPRRPLAAGEAQLLRIARNCSADHDYDQAARIYRHILDNYPRPRVAADRYHYLLGELYSHQAARLVRQNRPEQEVRPVLVAAARDFMLVPSHRAAELTGKEESPLAADAWWQAGQRYFQARRYDGASRAFGEFAEFARRFGGDGRLAEALYLWGDSLRQMGSYTQAAEILEKAAVEHPTDQFGYLAELALGETYLDSLRLEAAPDEKDQDLRRNARAVFESIRRDARYTPESQVWMKSLFHLGETYYRLGRSRLARSAELGRRPGKDAGEAKALADDGRKLLGRAEETLEEASERYPPEKYAGKRPSFEKFLRAERLPVMHMLAMISLELEQYDQAVARFAEILRATTEVGAFDPAEADQQRRAAHSYKGIAELRWGAAELQRGDRPAAAGRFQEAAETFRKAHEEFARSADGPWFAQARGMALERAGRSEEARTWYARSADGRRELPEGQPAGPSAGRPALAGSAAVGMLPPAAWRDHNKWLLERM